METLLIVIHLMVVLVLVGVILLQKSEGGGLDMGGGSGFMTARSAANTLTRLTAILATIFFITSLGLSLLARYGEKPMDILDRAPITGQGKGVLDQLPGGTAPAGGTTQPAPAQPSVPADAGSATTAPAPAPATAPAGEPASGAAAPTAGDATPQPATPQVPNN